MSKPLNISVALVATLAGLMSTSALVNGDNVVASIAHTGGIYFLLFVLPLIALVVAITALYGMATREEWWYVCLGLLGVVLSLGGTYVAGLLVHQFGETGTVGFPGYAIPLAYVTIYTLGAVQVARTWAGRLDTRCRTAIDAARQPSSDGKEGELPALLTAFVGSRRYDQRWDLACEPLQVLPKLRWLWPAVLFGSLWWFYRKLYRVGIILFVVESVSSFALGLLLSLAYGDHWGAPALFVVITLLIILMVRLPLSLIADRIYLAHALAVIEGVKQKSSGEAVAHHVQLIGARGGVSIASMVALLVVNYALMALMMII